MKWIELDKTVMEEFHIWFKTRHPSHGELVDLSALNAFLHGRLIIYLSDKNTMESRRTK